MNDFFTLAWLGTAAGIVAAVALMVQVCKYLLPITLDPRIYCLVWSAVFNLAYILWINPAASMADWFCVVINILLVAVAASGTFEYAIKPIQQKLGTASKREV